MCIWALKVDVIQDRKDWASWFVCCRAQAGSGDNGENMWPHLDTDQFSQSMAISLIVIQFRAHVNDGEVIKIIKTLNKQSLRLGGLTS